MHYSGNRVQRRNGLHPDGDLRAAGEGLDAATGNPLSAPCVCAAAGHGPLSRAAARLRRRTRRHHGPSLHERGHRRAHARALGGRDAYARLRSLYAPLCRTRQRGKPAPVLRGQSLDRYAADHPADRGAGRGDAGGDQPQPGHGGGPHAADLDARSLAVHRRESGGQRGDGRRQARVLPRDPGPGRDLFVGPRGAQQARPRRWRSSTVPCARRSG